jgi:predicted esterase
MKSFSGATRYGGLPRRWCWYPPQVAALSLLMLAFSIGASLAQAPSNPKPRDHVYLLRGFANVFSLGMDQIATKLEHQGIDTTVDNYLSWPTLAKEAAAEYKSGRVRTIILVGHSSGATAVTEMAARLSELGVPVKLAIGLDPTSHMTASGHVDRYVNYYIAHEFGDPVDKSRQFSGVLQNVNLEHMRGVNHFNIDKDRAVQGMVIRDIQAALANSPYDTVDAPREARKGPPVPQRRDVHNPARLTDHHERQPGLVTDGTAIRD